MSDRPEIPHSRPTLTREDREAVAACLTVGSIAQGRLVEAFEATVASRLGKAHAVASASGTSALVLALRGLGLRPGVEVILPSYVCYAVRDAVLAAGASPVYCDIGAGWSMTPEAVERVVTPRTGAIVVVHNFGIAVPSGAFRRFGVPLVDDICQSFGAPIPPGADVTCASFQATKLLTTGEGGMVLTDDAELIERVRLLRDGAHGRRGDRVPAPLTDLQAALGLSQLARFEGFLARRKAIADTYFRDLDGLACRLPLDLRQRSIFFRFPLRVARPFEEVQRAFMKLGIHVRRGVDALLHHADGASSEHFPGTEEAFAETVCLPILPSMSDDDVTRVVLGTREIFSHAP